LSVFSLGNLVGIVQGNIDLELPKPKQQKNLKFWKHEPRENGEPYLRGHTLV